MENKKNTKEGITISSTNKTKRQKCSPLRFNHDLFRKKTTTENSATRQSGFGRGVPFRKKKNTICSRNVHKTRKINDFFYLRHSTSVDERGFCFVNRVKYQFRSDTKIFVIFIG